MNVSERRQSKVVDAKQCKGDVNKKRQRKSKHDSEGKFCKFIEFNRINLGGVIDYKKEMFRKMRKRMDGIYESRKRITKETEICMKLGVKMKREEKRM